MTLQLDLPHDLETELAQRAAKLGLPLSEYAVRLLTMWRSIDGVDIEDLYLPTTGPALVEYWQREGLIGTRPDITDSQKHARSIRHDAEHRERTTR